MNRPGLLLTLLLASVLTLLAAPPTWWSEPQTQILDPANPATLEDNYSPANLGQLKHVAKQAKAHLDANLLGGAGAQINDLVSGFGSNLTTEQKAANYAPINLGQLKAVAKPFYDRLLLFSYDTKANLIARGFPSTWASNYPWNSPPPKEGETGYDQAVYSAWMAENYAPANLGQLKATFSFDLDSDDDGLSDIWELTHFGDLDQSGTGDLDGDGLTNAQEFASDTNPTASDSDGDGLPDGFEVVIGTNPASGDTNGNGMPDGEELANGGTPWEPGPPPAILPPPPEIPLPPPDPLPTPPELETAGDFDILIRTKSVSMPKYGFDTFQPTNPAKRYLVRFDQDYHTPTSAAPNFPYQSVTLTRTVDPQTGLEASVSSVSGTFPDMQCQWPQTESRATLRLSVAGANADANGFRDSGYFMFLHDENTTEDMVDSGIATLGAFDGELESGTPFAYRNVHENELRFDYQKVEFKFRWQEDVQPEDHFPVKYLVLFKPENNPETSENESETQMEVVKTIDWDGENAEETFTIDPDALKPDKKDGTYSLLPVQIEVRKQGTTKAPDDGLLVKKGDVLEFALAPQFFDTDDNFETLITWQQRQLNGDGTYTEWSNISAQATGTKFEHTTAAGGIFQIKAIITNGGEHEYKRKKNAPHGSDSGGTVNPIYKKDQLDYVGVCDEQWQIDVRDAAKAHFGSLAYAKSANMPVHAGGPSTVDMPKCNIFVYHVCIAGGVAVPLTTLSDGTQWPPTAKRWWSQNVVITGWSNLLQTNEPQPGYVVSRPGAHVTILGRDFIAAGHVGILDYDGAWINAGSKTVNKFPHLTPPGGEYQPARMRKKN